MSTDINNVNGTERTVTSVNTKVVQKLVSKPTPSIKSQ
jgi:hypothetical protein